MHRITTRILYSSNAFQNKNVPINERFYVSPPPYYLDWFEISYPNVTFNIYYGLICPQFMSIIQGTKLAGRKWNRLLDAVVTIITKKRSIIYHAIYIKVFSGGILSYLTVSTENVLDTTNNEIFFPELTIFLKHFYMKS